MEQKISLLGLGANLFLGLTKIVIGILSRSTAVLAEGIHSGMDVVSSIISYAGLRASKKPADKEHPYGHYKIEVLSGFVITIILFLTGFWILCESVLSLLSSEIVEVSYFSVGIMVVSAFINAVMSHLKIKYGKKYNSISLVTDGVHSKVDVLTSFAVIIGLIVSRYFIYADALIAVLIGFYIIRESISLGKEATDSLLDTSAGEEIENTIKELVQDNDIRVVDLKTQKRGPKISSDIVISFPDNLNVAEVSKIIKGIETVLMNTIKNMDYVSIQIDSQEYGSNCYKAKLGRNIKWERAAKGQSLGPEGFCICPNCAYQVKHEKGVPCSELKCPLCNTNLKRKIQ